MLQSFSPMKTINIKIKLNKFKPIQTLSNPNLRHAVSSTMTSEDQALAVVAPAAEEAPAPKKKTVKKTQVKGQDSSSDKPKYR